MEASMSLNAAEVMSRHYDWKFCRDCKTEYPIIVSERPHVIMMITNKAKLLVHISKTPENTCHRDDYDYKRDCAHIDECLFSATPKYNYAFCLSHMEIEMIRFQYETYNERKYFIANSTDYFFERVILPHIYLSSDVKWLDMEDCAKCYGTTLAVLDDEKYMEEHKELAVLGEIYRCWGRLIAGVEINHYIYNAPNWSDDYPGKIRYQEANFIITLDDTKLLIRRPFIIPKNLVFELYSVLTIGEEDYFNFPKRFQMSSISPNTPNLYNHNTNETIEVCDYKKLEIDDRKEYTHFIITPYLLGRRYEIKDNICNKFIKFWYDKSEHKYKASISEDQKSPESPVSTNGVYRARLSVDVYDFIEPIFMKLPETIKLKLYFLYRSREMYPIDSDPFEFYVRYVIYPYVSMLHNPSIQKRCVSDYYDGDDDIGDICRQCISFINRRLIDTATDLEAPYVITLQRCILLLHRTIERAEQSEREDDLLAEMERSNILPEKKKRVKVYERRKDEIKEDEEEDDLYDEYDDEYESVSEEI